MALPKSSIGLSLPFKNGDDNLPYFEELLICSRSEASEVATRINRKGLVETVPANGLRINYDPVTGECLGLLVEPAATNLLKYSQDLYNAVWSQVQMTPQPNYSIAPDGTLTGTLLTAFIDNAYYLQYANVITNTLYTFSIWLKIPFGTLNTKLYIYQNGVFNSKNITINTEWKRFSLTFTSTYNYIQTAIGGYSTLPIGTQIEAWGAQLEEGSYPTSYIKTTSAAVTRNADIVQTKNLDWFLNKGTFVVEYENNNGVVPTGQYPRIFSLKKDGLNNELSLLGLQDSHSLGRYIHNGTTGNTAYITDRFGNGRNKVSLILDNNKLWQASNGEAFSTLYTDTGMLNYGSDPLDTFTIGASASGSYALNGHIRSLTYYTGYEEDAFELLSRKRLIG